MADPQRPSAGDAGDAGSQRRWGLPADPNSALLAVVLAILVWLVANESTMPMTNVTLPPTGELPISFDGLPDELAIYEPSAHEVEVRLRGVRGDDGLGAVSVDDLRAYVDLSGVSPGADAITVPVQVECHTCPRRAVRVIGSDPPSVTVRLQARVTEGYQVRVNVPSAVPSACRKIEPEVQPPTVMVTGAASRIETVSHVVAEMEPLDVESGRVESELPVAAVNRAGEAVPDVTLEPETVSVTLRIVDVATCVEAAVLPVYNGSPAAGYYVADISVDPASVELTGALETLAAIREQGSISTRGVNISGAQEVIQEAVSLDLPSGVTAMNTEMVTVTISVSPYPGTRAFEVPVVLEDVPPGLSVDTVSPSRIQVFLGGPSPTLNALSADDISATVSLVGLTPGSHRLIPTFDVPEDVGVRSATPTEVEIELARQAP